MAVLGAPDLVVLTLSEFAGQAYRIGRAGNLALLVDSDHGYGNALNVKRTVEELETAGVAALTIEDTLLPRPFGSGGKPSLISLEEGIGKMRAALAGRQDSGLVIAGRTSALAISGVEEAIRRAKAYEAAGVDAMFLSGAKARAEVEAVAAAVRIPLLLGGTTGDLADLDFLSAHNVKICLQGHAPFSAAVHAVYETLKALRDGVPPRELKNLASAELMRRVTRAEDYGRWTKEYLGGG
jgi:carboxyvinyl-carboxyphosphonate phosphorylmutase